MAYTCSMGGSGVFGGFGYTFQIINIIFMVSVIVGIVWLFVFMSKKKK